MSPSPPFVSPLHYEPHLLVQHHHPQPQFHFSPPPATVSNLTTPSRSLTSHHSQPQSHFSPTPATVSLLTTPSRSLTSQPLHVAATAHVNAFRWRINEVKIPLQNFRLKQGVGLFSRWAHYRGFTVSVTAKKNHSENERRKQATNACAIKKQHLTESEPSIHLIVIILHNYHNFIIDFT